jgi:hypothetical protein
MNSLNGKVLQFLGYCYFFAGLLALLKSLDKHQHFKMDSATLLISIVLPADSFITLYFNDQIELIPQTLAFMFAAFADKAIIKVLGVTKTIIMFIYVSCAFAIVDIILEFKFVTQRGYNGKRKTGRLEE